MTRVAVVTGASSGIGAAVAATVFILGNTTTNMYQSVANIF